VLDESFLCRWTYILSRLTRVLLLFSLSNLVKWSWPRSHYSHRFCRVMIQFGVVEFTPGLSPRLPVLFFNACWHEIFFHNHPSWEFWCSDWLSCCKLQPITFDLLFISDKLVSTRYHPGFSLVQWFHAPLLIGWRFHNQSTNEWKEGILILTLDGYVW